MGLKVFYMREHKGQGLQKKTEKSVLPIYSKVIITFYLQSNLHILSLHKLHSQKTAFSLKKKKNKFILSKTTFFSFSFHIQIESFGIKQTDNLTIFTI